MSEIRLTTAFQAIHRDIWHCLRTEVMRADAALQDQAPTPAAGRGGPPP